MIFFFWWRITYLRSETSCFFQNLLVKWSSSLLSGNKTTSVLIYLRGKKTKLSVRRRRGWLVCDHICRLYFCDSSHQNQPDSSGSFFPLSTSFQNNSELQSSGRWKMVFFPVIIIIAILGSSRMDLKSKVNLVTLDDFLPLLKSLVCSWTVAEQSAYWTWKINTMLENFWCPKITRLQDMFFPEWSHTRWNLMK